MDVGDGVGVGVGVGTGVKVGIGVAVGAGVSVGVIVAVGGGVGTGVAVGMAVAVGKGISVGSAAQATAKTAHRASSTPRAGSLIGLTLFIPPSGFIAQTISNESTGLYFPDQNYRRPVAEVSRLFVLIHLAVWAALESLTGHDSGILRRRARLVHSRLGDRFDHRQEVAPYRGSGGVFSHDKVGAGVGGLVDQLCV